MNNRTLILTAAASLALTACNSNTAPGNDTEAQLDAPATAAPQEAAATALAGAATGGLQPATLNEADIAAIGGTAGRCVFRLTEIGYPSFVHGGNRRDGTIKLNGKLITLAGNGQQDYGDGGLKVSIRRDDQSAASGERHEAEMIVMLPGAKDELGFRGFEECPAAG